MSDAHLPIIGQPKPFRILKRGAAQKVPTLVAAHLDQPLGARFMGMATSLLETSKGPALEIMVAGPGGMTVAAIITAETITAALEALNSTGTRLADRLAPEGETKQ